MVLHFIKRFRKIKRTETDSGAAGNIAINNRSNGVYSVGAAKLLFKAKLVFADCKESCINNAQIFLTAQS